MLLSWNEISQNAIRFAKEARHYTSEREILKVIRSLFLDDLRAELEKITGRAVLLHRFDSPVRAVDADEKMGRRSTAALPDMDRAPLAGMPRTLHQRKPARGIPLCPLRKAHHPSRRRRQAEARADRQKLKQTRP